MERSKGHGLSVITCTYLHKSVAPAHLASLSFAGFEEARSHLGELHVGRNCGKPQGVKESLQPPSGKKMKDMQGSEFCQ